MFLVNVLRYALFLLVPLSIITTSYLYLYPVFHLCAFPSPDSNAGSAYLQTFRDHLTTDGHGPAAPFRLLALGDPQLEGNTAVKNAEAASYPHFRSFLNHAVSNHENLSLLERIRQSLHELVDLYFDDLPKALEVYRKTLDLFGNDYYLAHIYRTVHWWTRPTHVSVLGDLLGSQWISDEEFSRRSWRFWNRAFKSGTRVEDALVTNPSTADFTTYTQAEYLGEHDWSTRLINVAGNHDIGYAGDLTMERFTRFEAAFGKANYELRFHLNLNSTTTSSDIDAGAQAREIPELRIVNLNNMNLDGPAVTPELQQQTYAFINDVIGTSYHVERTGLFTLLLTHIPLYKEAGICVDGPFFDFHEEHYGGGVKEQNHLSYDASKGILEGLFGMSGSPEAEGRGMGRRGLIINGHDHEGCDTYHFIKQSAAKGDTSVEEDMRANAEHDEGEGEPETPTWHATVWKDARKQGLPQDDMPGLREITVRSMMGDYAGNAGLLSLWFDTESWQWKSEYSTCSMGTPVHWWVIHVVDLITIVVGVTYLLLVTASAAYRCACAFGYVAAAAKESNVNVYGNGKAVNGKIPNGKTIVNGIGIGNGVALAGLLPDKINRLGKDW